LPSFVEPINESPVGQINVQDHFGFLGGKSRFLGSLLGTEVQRDVVSSSSEAVRTRAVFDGAQDLFAALQTRTFNDTCATFLAEINIDATFDSVFKDYKDMVRECNKDVGYIIWVKGDHLTVYPDIMFVFILRPIIF